MTSPQSVEQLNLEVAHKINDEAKADSSSTYAGKFVGLANGQVVVVCEDLDEAVRQLRLAEPDSSRTFIWEAGVEYEQPQEIWSQC